MDVGDDPHISAPTNEAASGSLPVGGPSPPRTPHPGKMSLETGNSIARMYVSGAPLSMIASTFGRSVSGIKLAIETHLAPTIEEVRGQVMREVAMHQFEMLAMLPLCRSVVQGGLSSADERTRLDTARWVIEATVPKPVSRSESDIRLTGNVNHDVSGVLEQIGTSLAAIRSANNGRDPLARVKTGADALPRLMIPPSPTDDAA